MAKLQEHVASRGADCMAGLGRAFRIVDRCVHADAVFGLHTVLTQLCAAATIHISSTAMNSSAPSRSGA